MNRSLWFAIKTQRESIAFDLIEYSKEKGFTLLIREQEILILIKASMFLLIEDLVNANCFFMINKGNLGAHDKF